LIGVRIGNTQKYPFYSSYTNRDDTRRLKRPTGVPFSSVMWNIKTNTLEKPERLTYENYVHSAIRVQNGSLTPKECGINGLWLLHELPYSHLIYKTKDLMHTSYNIVKDSIQLLKPNNYHTVKKNRTKDSAIIKICRENRIFPFMTSDNPIWPWIMTTEKAKDHDKRFTHVLGL
jgi:hypothetical protein